MIKGTIIVRYFINHFIRGVLWFRRWAELHFEVYKQVKVNQKEEVNGEVKDVEKEVTIRFDFVAPLGSSYDLVHEVLDELKADLKVQEDNSKKAEEEKKAANQVEAEKVEAKE